MEKEFKELVSILKEAKRKKFIEDFALTGALALSALTQPRATRDIDFLISVPKEKIPFLVDWLKSSKEFKFARHHTGRPKDRIKDLIEVPFGTTSADLLVATHEIEKDAVSSSKTETVFKVRVKVLGPEHLLILKLFAGSDQDIIDCAHLWNEPIDRKFVKSLSGELYLDGKLRKVEAAAKKILRG